MNQQMQAKVRISDNDMLVCRCGNQKFTQIFVCAKVQNPLVGQPALIVQSPVGFACSKCGVPAGPGSTLTRGELAGGQQYPEGEVQIDEIKIKSKEEQPLIVLK